MRSVTRDPYRTLHLERSVRAAPTAAQGPGTKPSGEPRLSVIIPTRNEEHTLGLTLDRVLQAKVWEIIVVDGRSSDGTREIAASKGAAVIPCAPGRGRQMNAGARAATGDVLLFLHADTSLPANYEDQIFRTLSEPGVCLGAFHLLIDAPGRSFRLLERAVAFRARRLRMPYGDQGLFLKTETFHRLGGFPELPIMEDYAFVRRARRGGGVKLADASVLTSSRRWIQRGLVRTTLHNRMCVMAYRLGVSPDRIARWRGA